MIDKKNPEIQKYVQEELQKQKEQIAERMIQRNIDVPYFGPTDEELKAYHPIFEEEEPSEKEMEEAYQKMLAKSESTLSSYAMP